MSEYTADEIAELVRDIKDEQSFRDRNEVWGAQRRLVFQERPVVIPGIEMETEYRTPELLEAADKFTARFLGAPFTVDVSAQGAGPKAIMKAQAMENYDYRLLSRWWAKGLFTGAIHDMCGVTGEGWVHLTLNREVLPVIPQEGDYDNEEAYLTRAKEVLDEFSKGERPDLFQLEPVREPETIYYTPDRSVIFAQMKVPLAPLQRQYARSGAGGLLAEKGKGKLIDRSNGLTTITSIEGGVYPEGWNTANYKETVLLYIVETPDCIYHLIEDGVESDGKTPGSRYNAMTAVGQYKNIFGAPGFVSVQARVTNHPSAKHAVHPLTHAAIAIAPNVNITGTIVYSGGILGEMQRVTLVPMPGAEAMEERRNNKNLEIELLGQRVIKFPDGYTAVQPNIGVNADTLNAFASLEAKMQAYGYPAELGNPSDVDASSGYQQAVMRDTVANVIDPPMQNIATMLNTLLQLKDTGIATLGLPVTFRNFAPTDEMGAMNRAVMDEITIDPDDIVEVDRVVRFDSLTQYARTARIEMYRGLLQEGRITEDMFFREGMGVDDPERLKRMRFQEKCQTIAEAMALKTGEALLQQVIADVSAEAMVESGMSPFVDAPPAEMAADPMGGISVSNGAGGAVPLQPAVNPMAELGAIQG